MTDFDIVAGLRSRSAWFKREDIAEVLENAANEIDRLNDKVSFVCGDLALQEIARLRERVRDLEQRHIDASFLLADWDGYYNPDTKQGNVEELASLIEDAYRILQNKSWRDEEPDSVKENTNG